jgi:prepilin-type N-terminal cleavage/methylation domain-containing protein
MSTRNQAQDRRGFTLIEALIAATLLAILFLAVAQTSARASNAFDEGSTEHTLQTGTHACLERIARAIEFADGSILVSGTVAGSSGDHQVTFNTPASFEGGVVTWSQTQIFTEYEPEELNDGKDNNGNGLADESQVVLIEDFGSANPRRVVLVKGVPELYDGESANTTDDNGNGLKDETGLSFSAPAGTSTVFVRLTCQHRDEDGRLLTKTAETAVRLRNNAGG